MATLFTPLQAGDIRLPNRIVMAPLTRGRAGSSHIPTDMLIRLTPENQLEDPCRYGAAGLSKDHARGLRSIVLTRGLSGLLGTVSLA